jgi:acetolactate synthase-1/2/3 large subunit
VSDGIPVKVFLMNNFFFGMVRQWQELFWDRRYSAVHQEGPDWVKLAEAYGCLGLRAEKQEDVDAVIQQALDVNDRPVVIDFIVHPDAMVWPMVPAGVSNDKILNARGEAPVWDRED